jgi:putative nucleotidyltransferase with HDIG domain
MPLRVKFLIAVTLAGAAGSLALISGPHPHDWVRFAVYLAVILLSAEMKVAMPKGDGTMSVNFPFILLGILQLSPLQAVALAAASVFAQCRIHVLKPFTLAQVAFNLGSVVVSTALACLVFGSSTLRGLELAPALALAATVYFLTNTIPVAMAIGWTNGESAFGLWRRRYPWFLPFYLVGAFFAAIVHLISIQFGWMTSLLIIPTVYTMHRAYRAQIASMLARQRHLEEIKAVHLRTIEALGLAIEAKDQGTHDHLLRVRVYVGEIGRLMGQNEMQLQALLTASFLHDIGKLAVPEHIINKPGRLTPEEFDKMKIHPVVGADILERIRFPYPVTPIVRSHHESWDGSGYPDGLKGEEIPVGARILKVVDCFDALSSNRPYRRALPMDEALAYIKHKAGIEFDPEVTAVLEDHYLELERLAQDDIKSVAPPGDFAPDPAGRGARRRIRAVQRHRRGDRGIRQWLRSSACFCWPALPSGCFQSDCRCHNRGASRRPDDQYARRLVRLRWVCRGPFVQPPPVDGFRLPGHLHQGGRSALHALQGRSRRALVFGGADCSGRRPFRLGCR